MTSDQEMRKRFCDQIGDSLWLDGMMKDGEPINERETKEMILDFITSENKLVEERVIREIEKMNNFRQAKVDGKEDWNEALEQSAKKVDVLLSTLNNK